MEADWVSMSKRIKACTLCDGLNSDELGTQNAPGYGNKNSKVAIIGQSLCGKLCIESQIPFTGGSGKLLDAAFEQAGLAKSDIFITNVVKCHPPNNRKSAEHEINNCSPYLDQELAWLAPSHIICLGKDAWCYFNAAIRKPCVKQVKKYGGVVNIHFLYHPSYIKRMKKPEQQIYIDSIVAILDSL
jgi:DNA polymerase